MPDRQALQRFLLTTVLLVSLLRVPSLVYPRAISDEAYYGVVANEMLHGGLPYRDAVDRKPPLLYGVFWAIFRLAGYPNWHAVHLVALLWTLATMAILYQIGRLLLGPWTGAFAALLYGLFLPYLTITNLALNGELLMNLPVVGAVYLVLRPNTRALRLDLVAAGGLAAASFLLKQPAGIVLLPLGVYCIHPAYRQRRSLAPWVGWFHATLIGLGFALVLGASGLLLYREGILGEAWYWTVQNHDVPHGPLDPFFWERAAISGGQFVLFCGPLLVGTWLALGQSTDRWQGLRAERDTLIVFALASLIGTAASGHFFNHYYLQLLPPLALLAAPALSECWTSTGEPPGARRVRAVTLGWTAVSVLVSFSIAAYDGMVLPPHQSPATEWIRAHAAPGDRLFVWGQDPYFYFESGCRPASRYFASFPLTGYIFGAPESWDPHFDTSKRIAPGAWDNLAHDFALHPPTYIVDTDAARAIPRYPMDSFPYLADLIRSRYQLAYKAPDGFVYVRRARRSDTG